MKNRYTPFLVHALSVGAVALLCQNAQSQSTLYDNSTSTYSGQNFDFDAGQSGTASAGNEVVLAGSATSDVLSSVAVQIDFNGTGPVTGSVDVSLFANVLASGNFDGYATPNTLISDLGSTALSSVGPFTGSSGGDVLTYSGLNITVPQDFTVVVSFTGLSSTETAGLSIYGNTTTGMNYNDAWVNTSGTWTLYESGGSAPAPQFGMKITGAAVPEPSTIALGVMGACAFLARRRKS